MDFEQKKKAYYALKPPVYVSNTNSKSSAYVISFSESEKKLIKEAILPEGLEKREIARMRHKMLLEMNKNATPEEQQWIYNMIINETCGFVKKMVSKYCFDQYFYEEMMNTAFVTVIQEFPRYESKVSEMTLTTYLTRPLIHSLKQYVNSERFKTTDHKSNCASKVQYALTLLKANGNIKPTVNDIKMVTGLNERTIVDALAAIKANNSINLEDKEVLQVASSKVSPEEHVLTSEKKSVVSSLLEQFSDIERQCIELRFDISGLYGEKRSVAKVAAMLNITANEVNKAINKAFRTLKRSQKLRNLIYGDEKTTQREKISDQKKINAFFEDILSDLDDEDNNQKPDSNENEKSKKELNMILPW